MGAVIKDGRGAVWLRVDDRAKRPWRGESAHWRAWSEVFGPITVLSAGWSE